MKKDMTYYELCMNMGNSKCNMKCGKCKSFHSELKLNEHIFEFKNISVIMDNKDTYQKKEFVNKFGFWIRSDQEAIV